MRIASGNFELFTTGGERSGRDLIRHFEQVRYFYNLAYANYRLGDSAKARAFLDKGRPYATNPEEAAQLDRLSQALAR